MKKIIISTASALILMGVAQVAFAIVPGNAPTGPQDLPGLLLIVDNIINLIFAALIVFSVIFIVMAAFQFISAGGDLAAVTQARQKLIYAVVGIIVALLAKSLPIVIKSFLNVPL
jgi:hypothetical protein